MGIVAAGLFLVTVSLVLVVLFVFGGFGVFVVLSGVVVSGFDRGVGNVLSRWVEVFMCVGPDVPSLNGVNGFRVFVGMYIMLLGVLCVTVFVVGPSPSRPCLFVVCVPVSSMSAVLAFFGVLPWSSVSPSKELLSWTMLLSVVVSVLLFCVIVVLVSVLVVVVVVGVVVVVVVVVLVVSLLVLSGLMELVPSLVESACCILKWGGILVG